jgi:hypothetical protein
MNKFTRTLLQFLKQKVQETWKIVLITVGTIALCYGAYHLNVYLDNPLQYNRITEHHNFIMKTIVGVGVICGAVIALICILAMIIGAFAAIGLIIVQIKEFRKELEYIVIMITSHVVAIIFVFFFIKPWEFNLEDFLSSKILTQYLITQIVYFGIAVGVIVLHFLGSKLVEWLKDNWKLAKEVVDISDTYNVQVKYTKSFKKRNNKRKVK